MTDNMRAILSDVQRGKSPFDNSRLSAPEIARAVKQCTEAGLIAQPRGDRVLTEAGRKALKS